MYPLAVFSPFLIGTSIIAILFPKDSLKKGQFINKYLSRDRLGIGYYIFSGISMARR